MFPIIPKVAMNRFAPMLLVFATGFRPAVTFDIVHPAEIDQRDRIVTFRTQGSRTLFLQVGLKEAEEDITVGN